MEMTDEELYEGFTKEQITAIQREVREKYDPAIVKESQERVRKMSKAQWQAMKKDGDEIPRALAALMDSNAKPDSAPVQQLIARHHAWIGRFYTVSPEMYRGLGQMYVEDARFRANYDKYRPGLADFMCAAMEYYCDHTLKK